MRQEDDEDDGGAGGLGTVRYPCMPSLVALQQMKNRLHMAYLGKKLMKWTAMATGREIRRVVHEIVHAYSGYEDDLPECYIYLSRCRFYYPNLNKMVLSNHAFKARLRVVTAHRSVAACSFYSFEIIDNGVDQYLHLGLDKGGQIIDETKQKWINLLNRLVVLLNLRTAFTQIDNENRAATKKMNVLGKVVIPKTTASIHYIIDELEELAREEFFRLKKVMKIKNRKRAAEVKRLKEFHKAEMAETVNEPPKIVTPVDDEVLSFTEPKPEPDAEPEIEKCVCVEKELAELKLKESEKLEEPEPEPEPEPEIEPEVEKCVCVEKEQAELKLREDEKLVEPEPEPEPEPVLVPEPEPEVEKCVCVEKEQAELKLKEEEKFEEPEPEPEPEPKPEVEAEEEKCVCVEKEQAELKLIDKNEKLEELKQHLAKIREFTQSIERNEIITTSMDEFLATAGEVREKLDELIRREEGRARQPSVTSEDTICENCISGIRTTSERFLKTPQRSIQSSNVSMRTLKDSQRLGIFETEVKEITRIIRTMNPNGTVREERTVLKIRKESATPKLDVDRLMSPPSEDSCESCNPYGGSKRVEYLEINDNNILFNTFKPTKNETDSSVKGIHSGTMTDLDVENDFEKYYTCNELINEILAMSKTPSVTIFDNIFKASTSTETEMPSSNTDDSTQY